MVLQCGLKLSTRCAGASWEVQAKGNLHMGPAWDHPNELSSLQMAATCAELGGARKDQVVNQGLLQLLLGLGPLSQRYRHADARCCLLQRF